jgi:8-oxo-dGTP diphosphatase
LDVWWVDEFSGNPKGVEGQPLKWVRKEDLINYEFPEANNEIVEAILNSESA